MQVANLDDYKMKLRHDGSFPVAVGKSRTDKAWKNRTYSWSQLLARLQKPTVTPESYEEYRKLPKAEQDRVKDVGGFVGGTLKGGRRKSDAVESRQLVTLDADFAPPELLEDIRLGLAPIGGAYAVYSTHKHCPDSPRLRFLIPLDRAVTPEEYEAVARKLAESIGMDYFDDTTYQASRLMYWPSVAQDGSYFFEYCDAPWIKADAVLQAYPDWTDTAYWPESSRTREQRKKLAKKQGDPTEKAGLIGAFCRAYPMEEAIAEFLPDVYLPCAMPGRYTYAEGSTAAGLVLYEDGKFAYSNHATDPAGGQLCNSFDLVRIHKFGTQDEDAAPDTPAAKLPSYKAMVEFVRQEEKTKLELARMRRKAASADFSEEEGGNWEAGLTVDKRGNTEATLNNALLILTYHPELKGIVFNQMADNLEIKGRIPWNHPGRFWRDADDAQLEAFLADKYTEFAKAKILTAVTKAADDRAYHPVRDYLDSLPEWDGVPRVDTLLIDYLGAEDCDYVRAVTRKTLCAAIARVRKPGCKFDTVLVLCGPQGIGKSTLIAKLGGEWFSDSLNLADTRDKTAAEKLQGYWIIEIGEMAGIGSAGVKTLRSFITTQDDRYRASYGRRVSSHPRQCILVGTTNSEDGYLNDVEGGRRFWPVRTHCIGTKKVWDITQEEVGQIWAEALYRSAQGESLLLSGEIAEEAVKQQKAAMVSDPREEMVHQYLEQKLPVDWYKRDLEKRLDYLDGVEHPMPEAELRRDFICAQEIWCECFRYPLTKMEVKDAFTIRRIMAKMEGWEMRNERRRIGADYHQQRGYSRKFGV